MKFLIFIILSLPVFATEPKALLVSPPELREAWAEYVALRAEQGVMMKLVTTTEISEKYEGKDIQEKIRLCAREHIDKHSFHTIILGGDSSGSGGLVPDRDTYHKNMWGNDQDIPSDIYYISPTNWDHDNDGVYGEFTEDREAITYPDGSVAIGRIPVRTAEDIAAYRNKVVSHIAQKPSTELVFTCEVRGAYPKVLNAGLNIIPEVWPTGSVYFLFSDKTSWDGDGAPGSYELSPANLSEQFAVKGMNKWHIHGHGLIDCWVLENRKKFSYDSVRELKNKDQPLVITTVSCFTGQFDAEKDPCITEAMLRQPDGGAVVVIAPAREGKPHLHNPEIDFPLMMREGKLDGTTEVMAGFWAATLGQKKNVGMALAHVKSEQAADAVKSATYHQGICELNLLGDPTLPVR